MHAPTTQRECMPTSDPHFLVFMQDCVQQWQRAGFIYLPMLRLAATRSTILRRHFLRRVIGASACLRLERYDREGLLTTFWRLSGEPWRLADPTSGDLALGTLHRSAKHISNCNPGWSKLDLLIVSTRKDSKLLGNLGMHRYSRWLTGQKTGRIAAIQVAKPGPHLICRVLVRGGGVLVEAYGHNAIPSYRHRHLGRHRCCSAKA